MRVHAVCSLRLLLHEIWSEGQCVGYISAASVWGRGGQVLNPSRETTTNARPRKKWKTKGKANEKRDFLSPATPSMYS